ncbi:putative protein N(5)-glutamine methyltransferase [Cellulomonas sp. PhB143]|uniref:putative protein N(5)-glutamine methyltransferase n=1 Tax=Cellulomonas sp. PhB143 TaxID=2485186 RepID=UPI000F489F1A|nr:putative protein N(5)-glutamine methyltransferase [Cellulomonas sp. PhB143]ROS78889.1 release factor glutamine methyltransferase [Cellulomonas sp. PhB143]
MPHRPRRRPAAPTLPASAAVASRYDDVVRTLRAAGCVFAEDEATVLLASADDVAQLDATVAQRVSGLPLEQVVGWAEICGLRVTVAPGVFVPRRRTETLALEASRLATVASDMARAADGVPVVVDLCCGSGAIALVVARALEDARPPRPVELHAADVEPAAVACARANLRAVGGAVHEGDLFDALPRDLVGRIDVLTANVPYVPSDEVGLLPAEARLHEPLVTLDGGRDGLVLLRRVAATAPRWLAPGGHVLVETSERQRSAAVDAFDAAGLTTRVVSDPERGATVVVGTLPA